MTFKTENLESIEREAMSQTFAQKYGIKNFLQFFADDPEDDPEDKDPEDDDLEDSEDSEDDDLEDDADLRSLIAEDPELKKQFNEMFKERFDKRLKGIDLKRAKQLIKEDDKRQEQGNKKDKKDNTEDDNSEVKELESKLTKKMLNLAVKEYALENGYNHKLVSRLMDKDSIEIGEDGDIDEDDLESAIMELEEEFPEIKLSRFKDEEEDEDEDEDDNRSSKRKKSSSHRVAGKKKSNKKRNADPKSLGAQKALERYKDRLNK